MINDHAAAHRHRRHTGREKYRREFMGGGEEGAKSKGEVQRSGRAAGAANTIVVRLAIGLTPKYQVIAVERGKTNLLTTIPPSYECRCTS